MIADGAPSIYTAPWSTLFPGLAISLVVMSLNAVADGCGTRSTRARTLRDSARRSSVLLRVRNLKTYFVTEHGKGTARAVDDVSFDLYPGETLGIVGIGVRQDRHVPLDSPARAGAAGPRARRQPDRIRRPQSARSTRPRAARRSRESDRDDLSGSR